MEDDVFEIPLSSLSCERLDDDQHILIANSLSDETSDFIRPQDDLVSSDDILRNGVLIQTSKGIEWISLTEALTSEVGDLNLSVEDFHSVTSQFFDSQDLTDHSDDQFDFHHLASPLLESIEETCESSTGLEDDDLTPACAPKLTLSPTSHSRPSTADRSASTATNSESNNSDSSTFSVAPNQVKRKGGWPKGRKRKPELSENRPPKAPSTGYVLYLNEKRKLLKNRPFPEVTKILGNEWSRMSLAKKKVYLDRAERDKIRYKEELRKYHKSDAYLSYLRRKRIKSLQANGTEESDIDATDFDEEDNEELYCRACNQWFTSFHNKKEHMYGRQHFQNVKLMGSGSGSAQEGSSSVQSLDESSLDAAPLPPPRFSYLRTNDTLSTSSEANMEDAIALVMHLNSDREKEVKQLQNHVAEQEQRHKQVLSQVVKLKEEEARLLALLQKQQAEAKQYKAKMSSYASDIRKLYRLTKTKGKGS
nr:PREDICTED: uncharacterized protein LOC109032201 [Bemisia tabaci]